MADKDFILAPTTVSVAFDIEPVHNILASILILNDVERLSGLSDWVVRTAATLSPEQKHTNTLVCAGFFHAVEPLDSWPSFPHFLDHLEQQDANKLRNRAMDWIYEYKVEGLEPPDRETLLADRQVYVAYVEEVYARKHRDKGEEYHPVFPEEIHAYLNDPPAMKALILTHLRTLWNDALAEEWEHVLPMLHESVAAFQQVSYSGLTALEAVRAVTKRDLSGIWETTPGDAERMIFAPSAHIGPYLMRFDNPRDRLMRVIFGARLPEGAKVSSPALSRSEMLVRLNALADETRLRILELLTVHEELCAQDIIERLDLSQSSASRHLRQLTATGYLVERRREVAKCYSLNAERVDDTFAAIQRLLRGK